MPFDTLILTQNFPPRMGGIENFMHGLARTLAQRHRKLLVLADCTGAAPYPTQAEDATLFRLRVFRGMKPLRSRLKACYAAFRLAAQPAPAPVLVFADSWKSLQYLPARRGNACRVCFLHGMEFPEHPSRRKRERIRRACTKADIFFANSHFTAARAQPFLPEHAAAHAVEPCIGAPAAPQPHAVAALRARLGGGPVLVTICRLEPRKGIAEALHAVARMHTQFPGLCYAIAGIGPDRARLEQLAQTLGITPCVQFLGRISDADKAALLHLADVFVMPVWQDGDSVEGYGAAYIEAGCYGVPSVAGRSGGAAEAVEHNVTGIVCENIEAEPLAETLARLLRDDAFRKQLGENARRKAASLIWETGIDRYLQCIAKHTTTLGTRY